MFTQLKEKHLFEKAQNYANQYIDTAFNRNVFPADEALKQLVRFDETMPLNSSDASKVIDLLHRYGAPATITSIAGRYFGFVTGSSVPVGLAAKHLATYWDQNSAMNVLSPIASKLESVVESWLKELFGLPDEVVEILADLEK